MENANKKVATTYECKKCNYVTYKKSSWNKHLTTQKHKKKLFYEKVAPKEEKKDLKQEEEISEQKLTICPFCNKAYKHYTSLLRHRKKCSVLKTETKNEVLINKKKEQENIAKEYYKQLQLTEELKDMKKIMQTMIDQQEETKKQLHQLNETGTGNTTNNMTINVYLNQYCKNAMNMTDFVEKLKLSTEDLLYTKDNGYIKGISNIIVKNLQDLTPTERPIHCSDKKRLQFYVKEENKWEKDETNHQIKKSISAIRNKQIKQIKEWEKLHPEWNTNDEETELYAKMVKEVMGYDNDNEKNKEEIKKEISKTVDMKEIRDIEI